MELILNNPGLLKKSIEIISDIVLEGTFVFKEEYVELVALNANSVAMIIFRLLSTNFEKYDIEKNAHISLSLEHFSEILKRCNEKAPLTLMVNENKNRLKIISEGKNRKEFEISLIEFNEEELQKVPSLDFPVKIVASSQDFTNAINDLNFLEEEISLNVEDKKLIIQGRTNTLSGKVEFKDNIDIKNSSDEEIIEAKYAIEYLKKFIKADKIVNSVEISFNKNYPLKIEYKLIDKLLLGFILAPRGED